MLIDDLIAQASIGGNLVITIAPWLIIAIFVLPFIYPGYVTVTKMDPSKISWWVDSLLIFTSSLVSLLLWPPSFLTSIIIESVGPGQFYIRIVFRKLRNRRRNR